MPAPWAVSAAAQPLPQSVPQLPTLAGLVHRGPAQAVPLEDAVGGHCVVQLGGPVSQLLIIAENAIF